MYRRPIQIRMRFPPRRGWTSLGEVGPDRRARWVSSCVHGSFGLVQGGGPARAVPRCEIETDRHRESAPGHAAGLAVLVSLVPGDHGGLCLVALGVTDGVDVMSIFTLLAFAVQACGASLHIRGTRPRPTLAAAASSSSSKASSRRNVCSRNPRSAPVRTPAGSQSTARTK